MEANSSQEDAWSYWPTSSRTNVPRRSLRKPVVSKGALVVLALVVDAVLAVRGSTERLRFVGVAVALGSLGFTGFVVVTGKEEVPRAEDSTTEEAASGRICEAAEIGRRRFVGEGGSRPMLLAA